MIFFHQQKHLSYFCHMFFYYVLFSLALFFVLEKTKSIRSNILLHSVYNMLIVITSAF
ncbi:type II CAAX prenyl endopeptidase Rce1 family protein [Ligilactobacillus acidipiscis]|uniref:CPBP family glutamic-type intramembrane protease n=1 Tax=Ligilactobacillus acidipiscis TaxID=89059 RepID=UPI003624E6C0